MNPVESLMPSQTPPTLLLKSGLSISKRSEKKPSHATTLPNNAWLIGPMERSSYPGNLKIRFGYLPRISSHIFHQRSLPLNDMDPSKSKQHSPLSHSDSNYHSPGNPTPSSMLLSYCPIKRQKSMDPIMQNPHRILLTEMKNTK